jgi:hypothetical protein
MCLLRNGDVATLRFLLYTKCINSNKTHYVSFNLTLRDCRLKCSFGRLNATYFSLARLSLIE